MPDSRTFLQAGAAATFSCSSLGSLAGRLAGA
ncbi:MAG: hypothetical protein H6Q10_2080, partial [Acidobacteria bacterium]|nr:hypothetical protein [Acidobacteriota bacterium]